MVTFKKIRRYIVVTKYTMARGYIWCQTPTMAIIGAGVIKPYFPMFEFHELAIIGACIFMAVGYIDRKFEFLNEELSYSTSKNNKLLEEIRKK